MVDGYHHTLGVIIKNMQNFKYLKDKIVNSILFFSILCTGFLSQVNAWGGFFDSDNRRELPSSFPQSIIQSVGALIHINNLDFKKNSEKVKIIGEQLGKVVPSCEKKQKFKEQVRFAKCSSVLIGERTVLTAGHCIENRIHNRLSEKSEKKLKNMRIIFGVKNSKEIFLKKNVYKILGVKSFKFIKSKMDYAVLELDRPVIGYKPIKIHQGDVLADQNIYSLSYSQGTSLKINTTGVLNFQNKWNYRSTIDSFQSESGAPVFTKNTNELVGWITSGPMDYEFSQERGCLESVQNIYSEREYTRIGNFSQLKSGMNIRDKIDLEIEIRVSYFYRYKKILKNAVQIDSRTENLLQLFINEALDFSYLKNYFWEAKLEKRKIPKDSYLSLSRAMEFPQLTEFLMENN